MVGAKNECPCGEQRWENSERGGADSGHPDDGKGRKCSQKSRKEPGPGGTTPRSGFVLPLAICLKIVRGEGTYFDKRLRPLPQIVSGNPMGPLPRKSPSPPRPPPRRAGLRGGGWGGAKPGKQPAKADTAQATQVQQFTVKTTWMETCGNYDNHYGQRGNAVIENAQQKTKRKKEKTPTILMLIYYESIVFHPNKMMFSLSCIISSPPRALPAKCNN